MTTKAFVNRESELQVLETYLTQGIEAKKGTIVFVTGEAGVGKSELISQIRDKVFKVSRHSPGNGILQRTFWWR